MQTHDDQMIFEKYQQINEIALPFTGGKQMSLSKRLKKFIPGRIGKRAGNQIDVETDVNHFIGDLQDYADTTGTTVKEVIADPQKFNNWVQDTIKVNPQHIKNWSKLVAAAAAESKKMMHGYKALAAALTAAIYQRNEELRVSNRGQYAQQSAPEAPATPQGYTSAPKSTNAGSTQPAAQSPAQPAAQSPTQPAAAAQPAAQASGSAQSRPGKELKRYAAEVATKIKDIYKDKRAMMAAVPKFMDRVNKHLGIAPVNAGQSNKPAGLTTTPNLPVGKKQSNKTPRKSKVTAKESVYINSNVVTEDIKFIDCSRF